VTEQEDPVKLEPRTALGVDLGLSHAVTTSEGHSFDYPKYYAQAEKKQRAANKTLHRRKKGSKNRRKAQSKLNVIGKRVTNLRDEFCHQVSRKLVDTADLVVFEDLQIQNMLKNHHLAKSISDVSWGKLIQFTQSKAARAGKTVELVDPRNTSQRCSDCGEIVLKELSERTHSCPNCSLQLDRDHNAALNILTLGLRGIACGELTSGLGIRLSKRQLCEAGSPTP
jgi:putative transposase